MSSQLVGTVAKMRPRPWRCGFILSPWSIRHAMLDYFSCFSIEFPLRILVDLVKTHRSTGGFYFLKLSGEIRNMIYEYLLLKPTPSSTTTQVPVKKSHFSPGIARPSELDCMNWVKYPCSWHQALGWNYRLKPTFGLHLGLLGTNSQIHWEPSSIFYGLNDFKLLIRVFTKRGGTTLGRTLTVSDFGVVTRQRCLNSDSKWYRNAAYLSMTIQLSMGTWQCRQLCRENTLCNPVQCFQRETHCGSWKFIFVALIGMLLAAIKRKWVSIITDSKRLSEF